ncbi:MAG: Nramp family divalent metal transporter, partial [Patescibacteria group bacterium]|nr:Nramp family divalent metal transporter [Patescibacteria group bacterium]
LRILGPGLITGAADDDPSGIATYSQTGAQFGYGQLWTALFMLPFQAAVQEACARIGGVTGKGIAAVVRHHYGKPVLYAVVLLVLLANTINIGADIGAMAAAAKLIVPLPFVVWTLSFTVVMLVLEIFTSYKTYAKILKWLVLALLSYPLTLFIVKLNWSEVMKATVIPHIEFNFGFLFIITGVLGTTISPYMFFWQASEETEEEREHHMLGLFGKPHVGWGFIRKMRIDNFIGMFFSEIATWAIIVVAAAVLNTHGVTNIKTAADAAKALEPLVQSFPNAGFWAKVLFSVGIIGLGLLSVPVLAGSAAYALSEAFHWKEGLSKKLKEAHGFYGVITIATLLGLMINFIGIDPFKALVFTAVINGLVAVPLIFLIGLIANRGDIMGEFKSRWLSNMLITVTFIGMGAAAIGMLISFIR